MNFITSILEQGLIYGILALGIYITYKILDFPDLTVDGSFPLGLSLIHILSVLDITKDISEGLARVATSARVNGEVVDLRHVVSEDCELEILTFDNEEGKGAFWHTTSHIMAQAIKRLYPDTKLAIGPSIENGFYYDVDRETPFVACLLYTSSMQPLYTVR